MPDPPQLRGTAARETSIGNPRPEVWWVYVDGMDVDEVMLARGLAEVYRK